MPEEKNDIFSAVIEIPKGSDIKFEMDPKTGRMKIDRFINGPSPYPFNYGFIADTRSADGDALDVMVLSDKPIPSGSRIGCRPIGLLQMEDEGGQRRENPGRARSGQGQWIFQDQGCVGIGFGGGRRDQGFFQIL